MTTVESVLLFRMVSASELSRTEPTTNHANDSHETGQGRA